MIIYVYNICSSILASLIVAAIASQRPLFRELLSSNDCLYHCLLSGRFVSPGVYAIIL
jgi:hypothetical protein